MEKIGRNDLCHCGSGKKYKKCCLEKDREIKSQTPATINEIVTPEDLTIPSNWTKTPTGYVTPDGWSVDIDPDEELEDLLEESEFFHSIEDYEQIKDFSINAESMKEVLKETGIKERKLMELYGVTSKKRLNRILESKSIYDVEKDIEKAMANGDLVL